MSSLLGFLGNFAITLVISYIAKVILTKSMKSGSATSINLIAVAIPLLISFFGRGAIYYSILSAIILFVLYQAQDKPKNLSK